MKTSSPKIQVVDLFCGIGGLTHGFIKSGLDVVAGIDNDESCKYGYEYNNNTKFIHRDITQLTATEVGELFGETEDTIRVLAGCAPCQTFSKYNQKADSEDKRWGLLDEFLRLIEELSPTVVTMENVPGLMKKDVFHRFVDGLESQGYHVNHGIVNCTDYGVPQSRHRLVLLASTLGPIKLMPPNRSRAKSKSVRDAIGRLRPLRPGQADKLDPLHQCSELSDLNMKRMRASKAGGTWRDWPSQLKADCHNRDSGKTYAGVYGRMSWDNPSPTITTQFFGFGNGRFGHPEQDRAISLREGAILQSFPKSYRFVEAGQTIYKKKIGRLIGNAVPVKLGKIIGRSIKKHVERHDRQ